MTYIDTHTLTWRAVLTDTSWPGAGGPDEIELAVMSVAIVQQMDRVPSTRATIVVSPPAEGHHWISPLHLTGQIELWATYNGDDVRHVGVFQLRRRRLSWPIDGGITLDCASWDGDAADRMSQAEDIADAFAIEEDA